MRCSLHYATIALLLAACRSDESSMGNTPAGPTLPTSRVAAVSMSTSAAQVDVGKTVQLTAIPRTVTGAGTSAVSLLWNSSAPNVASVTANGLVTGIARGTANVFATIDGHVGMAVITVVDTVPPPGAP